MNFKPNFKTKEDTKGDQPKYELVTKYMVAVSDLVTFTPDQSIQEAIDIIIDKRISGAPVLDSTGKLVGMLSEKDCLKIIVDQAYHNLPIESRKVSDYMTAEVKTVPPDSDVVSAANQFLHSPIRRMPVVDNGVLKGQISRRDILRAAKNFKATTW
ncbi:MAG TPA: inosine-5-monophosphate dehydrogenase [Cytophagales bacterium]|nr:inosine-5-monophosphate dehydrogenase [Cytophagales bacterium]